MIRSIIVCYFILFFYLACNANAITIGDIAQTKDSCAYVTFQYNGVGDLYVLNRVSKSNIPTARNIINEGIYLGKYEFLILTNS